MINLEALKRPLWPAAGWEGVEMGRIRRRGGALGGGAGVQYFLTREEGRAGEGEGVLR